MHDQRVIRRPTLCLINRPNGFGLQSIGTQAIDSFGGEGDGEGGCCQSVCARLESSDVLLTKAGSLIKLIMRTSRRRWMHDDNLGGRRLLLLLLLLLLHCKCANDIEKSMDDNDDDNDTSSNSSSDNNNDSSSSSSSRVDDTRDHSRSYKQRFNNSNRQSIANTIVWTHPGLAPVLSNSLTGDRINLSPTVLQSLLSSSGDQQQLPSPLIFSLTTCDAHRRRVYGCVREFQTEADDCVEMGPELFNKLGLVVTEPIQQQTTEQEQVTTISSAPKYPLVKISLVSQILPKCEYLKIVPMEAEYSELADIRALLESHLRKTRATISLGDMITVRQATRPSAPETEFHFLVSDIKPGETCVVVEVDVDLDVVPEQDVAEEALRKKFLLAQGKDKVDEIYDVANGHASGSVLAEMYRYFRMRTTSGSKHYTIELSPLNDGDCDLFISETLEKPNISDHDYANVDVGVSMVHFSVTDVTNPFMSVLFIFSKTRMN